MDAKQEMSVQRSWERFAEQCFEGDEDKGPFKECFFGGSWSMLLKIAGALQSLPAPKCNEVINELMEEMQDYQKEILASDILKN